MTGHKTTEEEILQMDAMICNPVFWLSSTENGKTLTSPEEGKEINKTQREEKR